MKFVWLLAAFSATVLAAPEKRNDAAPTATDNVNWSSLGQALYVLQFGGVYERWCTDKR